MSTQEYSLQHYLKRQESTYMFANLGLVKKKKCPMCRLEYYATTRKNKANLYVLM